jgi:hypothetical protein
MASISSLLGTQLSSTDLESRPVRIRYDLATSVSPSGNNVLRFSFPTQGDDVLDARSIFLRFNLNITNPNPSGTGTVAVDGPDVRLLFSRLKVFSGSTCLQDIEDLGTLLYIESQVNTQKTTSDYERYLIGNEDVQTRREYPNGREYIVRFAPKGSLLNSDCCVPVSRMSKLHFELTLNDAKNCLITKGVPSPEAQGISYNMSDIQCLTTYLRSKSLSAYFDSNPLAFHVTDYSRRYETIISKSALVRLPSAHTSLNGLVTVLRSQDQLLGGIDIASKNTNFLSLYHTSNLYLNSSLYFDVDTDSNEQRYRQLADVFPSITHSENFTHALYNTGGSHMLGIKVSAAPSEFAGHLLSGTNVRNLTSDIVLKIDLIDVPASPLVATTFLMSSCLIHSDGSARGDLRIKY